MIVLVDGIGINAPHFTAMKKSEAVKRMIEDGFVPGTTVKEKEEWAANAYDSLVNEVSKKKGASQ